MDSRPIGVFDSGLGGLTAQAGIKHADGPVVHVGLPPLSAVWADFIAKLQRRYFA